MENSRASNVTETSAMTSPRSIHFNPISEPELETPRDQNRLTAA